MRTISIYILREAAVPFFALLFVGLGLLIVNRLLKVLPWLFELNVPFADLLSVMLYLLPSFLIYALPIAAWVGWMVAYGRLGSDGELSALASVGASPLGMVRAGAVTGLITTVAAVAVCQWGYGQGRLQFQYGMARLAQQAAGQTLQPGTVARIGDATWLAVADVSGSEGPQQPVVYLVNEPNVVLSVAHAEPTVGLSGLQLRDGIAFFRGVTDTTFATFATGTATLSDWQAHRVYPGAREQTLATLWGSDNSGYQIELQQRLALSFSLLLAPLAAFAAAPRRSRSATGRSGLLSLLGFLIYYGLFTVGKQAALKGWLSPVVGLWAGDAFLLLVALLVIRRKSVAPGMP